METFNAKECVGANSYDFKLPADELWGAHVRCIDDRENRPPSELPEIALPGAGLGLVEAALGGVRLLEREQGVTFNIDMKEVAKAVENAIGSVTFHTDQNAVEHHDPLATGGCGHIKGSLLHSADYLLGPESVKFLESDYIPALSAQSARNGVKPVVYSGSHAARAVIVIDSPDIGLPSRLASGEQVYVYHQALHERLLDRIGDELYPFFSEKVLGVGKGTLKAAIRKAAEAQLAHTVVHLASKLPKFRVFRSESQAVLVSKLSETKPEPASTAHEMKLVSARA